MMARAFTLIWLCVISLNAHAQINFASPVPRIVGSDVESVAIGDVNNDGLNDAIIATSFYFDPENDYCIHVFLQQPDGTMAIVPDKYKFAMSHGNWAVVQVADVNNDNRNDVIFTFGDSLGIMYQNTSGTLDQMHSFYTGQTADGMDTGDLNNDGLTDIAVCHWNDNFIKVFYQLPEGGFQAVEYPIQSAGRDQLEINDMNGDGLADIIYMPGQSSGRTVNIFYQDPVNGIPSTPVTYAYEHGGYGAFNGIATGDLNNDGLNDLVGTIGGNDAWIAIVYQNEDGMLGDAIYLRSYDIPTPVQIADLNCDGKNEIVVGHHAWIRFSVWEQDENGNFSDYKLYDGLYYVGPYAMVVGDMNNDVRKDILTTTGSYSVNLIYNMTAPDGTIPYDTLVQFTEYSADTLSSWQDTSRVTFTSRVGECLLESTYKLHTTTYSIYEQQSGDTLYPRNFQLCGIIQADTLKSPFELSRFVYANISDSTFISADTLVENIVIISSITTYDTLGVEPFILEKVIEMLSYQYTADTLFMYLDSLHIRTYSIETEYIETIRTIFDGFICGIPVTDSMVQENHLFNTIVFSSDTTLISRTVYAYPLGIAQQKEFSGIRAFPNPAHSEFYLEIPQEYLHEAPFKISMLSTDGKLRKKLNITELKTLINASDMPAGIYIVLIEGKSLISAIKIILTL